MFAAQMWRRRLVAATWLVAAFSLSAEARKASPPSWDKIAGGREVGAPVVALIGLQQQKSPSTILKVLSCRRLFPVAPGVMKRLQAFSLFC